MLTKKDQVKDYRQILTENRQKLAATLDCPAEQITIIPVSNLAKLDANKSHDPEDLEESNFPALEKALWRFIDVHRGRIQLAKALAPLSRIVGELHLPLQTELDAYQQQDTQKRAEIEHELEITRDYLQQLQEKNAFWQVKLHHGIEDIHLEAQYRLERGFSELHHNLDRDLNSDLALEQRDLLLDDLQYQINTLLRMLELALNVAVTETPGEPGSFDWPGDESF